jgi:hypothetical protein
MNFTNLTLWRSNTAETFESLRFQAVLANLSAKILGKNTRLKRFSALAFQLTSKRIYLGEQDIPVSQINGSVGRENDFDNHFRPLKKHLRDRWIAVYSLFALDQLPPVQLFKVGSDYYVKDGHNRVSVAHATNRSVVRAEVWEIPLKGKKSDCTLCLQKSKGRSRILAHA